MAVYVITGELGSGKTLIAVSRIQEALQAGCQVATNLDLRLEHLVSGRRDHEVHRLPDWPKASDLDALGLGAGGKYDESKFGVLVLDEAATFINSREWGDKDRMNLIRWLLHARKLRWHVYLIVQDISMLDKQIRAGLAEHVVRCRRLDRVAVPILSWFTKLLQLGPLRLPQIHVGIVKYGTGPNAPVVDRWMLPFAAQFHEAYDTGQKIMGFNDGPATMLDRRHAPYMWAPVGFYENLWARWFWRWVPASEARSRHISFRLWDSVFSLYKPAAVTPSWADFEARTARSSAALVGFIDQGAAGGSSSDPQGACLAIAA